MTSNCKSQINRAKKVWEGAHRERVSQVLGDPLAVTIDDEVNPRIETWHYFLGATKRDYTREGFFGFYPSLKRESEVTFYVHFYVDDYATGCWTSWMIEPVRRHRERAS